jgi:NAD(P) transhydrogenase subunit alpha
MIVGIVRETCPGERRVALVPGMVSSLVKAGHQVLVEKGAGAAAGYPDGTYAERGGRLVATRPELFSAAQMLFMVRGPGTNPEGGGADLSLMRAGQGLIGFLDPLGALDMTRDMACAGVTAFALELIPRITRAQSMDALSSMASIAGYKAVLLAAAALPRIFPMMMTAAGSLFPAKVFVIGAGVAGLQACATARRLGALVSAYDLRPVAREQVESVGAQFVEFDLKVDDAQDKGGYAKAQSDAFYQRQQAEMHKVVSQNDVVITTAAVPGKRAPVLVTEAMVKAMAPGSVIVDLAAERGGNCELTVPGQMVERHGVTLIGYENLPATVPYHASQMLAKNITSLFAHLTDAEGGVNVNREDPITAGALVCCGRGIVNPQVKALLGEGGDCAAETEEGRGDIWELWRC